MAANIVSSHEPLVDENGLVTRQWFRFFGNLTSAAIGPNLTGPITSIGAATSIASQTGAGTTFAMSDSPTFTGIPAAPTAAPGTNTTQLATTAFVLANGAAGNLTGAVTSVGLATSLGSFTSANLAAALTDETGTGAAVFANSPVLTTPNIGNATGNISGNAATVTTNANLTGHVTSVGNAAVLGSFTSAQLAAALTDETGTGAAVFAASPTLSGTVTMPGTGVWNSLGQVGIGVASPAGKVDIKATDYTHSVYTPAAGTNKAFVNKDSTDWFLDLNRDTATGTFGDASATHVRMRASTGNGVGYMAWYTSNTNNTLAPEVMRLNGAGTLLANPSYANVKAPKYGAVGDGTTDDTTAIQSALNDAAYKAVYFPAGTYRITAALTSASKDLRIFGDGPSATIIKVDGAINGLTFTGVYGAYDADMLVVENIAFRANTGTALSAIKATYTFSGALNATQTVRITNVEVGPIGANMSFLTGFEMVKTPLACFTNCYITNYNFTVGFRAGGVGISLLTDATGGKATDFEVNSCTFLQCETAIAMNASGTAGNNNAEGLHVNAAQIINCTNGIKAGNAAALPADGLPLLNVNNSYIQASNIGVDIQGMSQWHVTGTLFYNVAGAGGSTGIKYTSGTTAYQVDGHISNNTFVDQGSGGTVRGVSVVGNAQTHETIQVNANSFEGMTNSCVFDANTDGASYTLDNRVISGGGASDAAAVGSNLVSVPTTVTTPTPTSPAGGPITATSTVAAQKDGRLVYFSVTISITNNNGGSGTIQIVLPYTATNECAMTGRQNGVGFNTVNGFVSAGSSTMNITTYNNAYPGATNERLTLSGVMYV